MLSNPINKAIRSQVKTSKEVSLHAMFSNLSKGCCENKITFILKGYSQDEKSYQGTELMTLESWKVLRGNILYSCSVFILSESLAHTCSAYKFSFPGWKNLNL